MSSQYWPEISSCLEEVEKEKQLIDHKRVEQNQIDMLKTKTSKILEELKVTLDKSLELSHSSLIQFALISYIDEQMQNFAHKQIKIHWAPLQQDLFGAHNAGEIFFKSCDDILEDRQTPSIVYEVYYFILKRGFKGRHKETKTQIAKYLELLQDRIATAKITRNDPPEITTQKKEHRLKPKHYYTIAAAASLLFILTLYLQSYLS
ncbi:MAG: hypothetical protein ChlgKO_01350 [Chlamydiales bacterium]